MGKNLSNVGVIANAAEQVWQAIGGDCLRALQECGEEPSMGKYEVVDAVLESFDTFASPEAVAIKKAMPFAKFRNAVVSNFKYRMYGF